MFLVLAFVRELCDVVNREMAIFMGKKWVFGMLSRGDMWVFLFWKE
jgi:hypothetical protein